MPAVKNVGEPCAGEPHARFDVAAGGNQASRLRRTAQAPPADPTRPATDPWGTFNLKAMKTKALARVRKREPMNPKAGREKKVANCMGESWDRSCPPAQAQETLNLDQEQAAQAEMAPHKAKEMQNRRKLRILNVPKKNDGLSNKAPREIGANKVRGHIGQNSVVDRSTDSTHGVAGLPRTACALSSRVTDWPSRSESK